MSGPNTWLRFARRSLSSSTFRDSSAIRERSPAPGDKPAPDALTSQRRSETLGAKPAFGDAPFLREGASPRREFVVHRDEHHIAFLPNFHVQRDYVLVAPIEHREGVVEDFPLDDYLALQTLVRSVSRALSQTVPTERIYVVSLGSRTGNAHVHWHVVALPPGVPYDKQQFVALMHQSQGVFDLTDDERSELSNELRGKIATEPEATT